MTKRILQILFLWIAGFGILGHSIIPHHHHDNENEKQTCEHSCEHEQSAPELLVLDNYDFENHGHDQDHSCSFQDDSFIMQTFPLLAATITTLLVIDEPTVPVFAYENYDSKITVNPFYRSKTTRGPPALV